MDGVVWGYLWGYLINRKRISNSNYISIHISSMESIAIELLYDEYFKVGGCCERRPMRTLPGIRLPIPVGFPTGLGGCTYSVSPANIGGNR